MLRVNVSYYCTDFTNNIKKLKNKFVQKNSLPKSSGFLHNKVFYPMIGFIKIIKKLYIIKNVTKVTDLYDFLYIMLYKMT